jgi:hypothetical protein
MMLPAIAIALLLQAAPASISGVVLNSGGNEPVANVRVSLARTDAALGAFAQMVAGDRPPGEITLPGELLAAMSERLAIEAANPNMPPEANAEAKAIAALGVENISEIVLAVNGDVAVVYKSTPPVQTDSQGRFSFSNIEPGTYKLIFSGSGYARQDYGQRDPGGSGIPIILGPAQARSDIVMRMKQVSAVSGRIADAAGRPVAGVPVQLFRFAYDETGKRKVQPVAAAQSDDRGLYRMFSLSPGRYHLSAGNPPGNSNELNDILLTVGGAPTIAANRIPQKYAVSYYPGAPELNSAAPIDVPSGADVRGIDMYLKEQQAYRVRGVVLDPGSPQPPRSANISLNLQNPDPRGGSYVSLDYSSPNYNPSDGTFELRNVSPGAYIVTAQLPNQVPTPPNLASMTAEQQRAYFDAVTAASAVAPRAIASINVVNSDIENVQLRVGTAGSLSGTLRADLPPNTPAPDFNFVRVQLRLADGSTPSNAPSMRPPKTDGTFRIDGVLPGEYVLVVNGLPTGFYLKEARLGDLDLLNSRLRFTGSESAALNIAISPNTGAVDGNVSDAQGQPLPGARVVMIPERNRERTELFRPAVSDPSGHFRIIGVAPGDYKLAAWDLIEPFAFFDPDLLKQADDNGKAIRVAESSMQTVNVAVIPGRAPN